MGKKRRLNSAMAKFRTKHSSHPRTQLLSGTVVVDTPVIAIEAPQVEATLSAILEEDTIEITPEVVAPIKKVKKTTQKRVKKTSS